MAQHTLLYTPIKTLFKFFLGMIPNRIMRVILTGTSKILYVE